ncbi:hypothetical protein [Actinotalea fermentans]|nr:hypothetical protein [Actinotalea fermentans]KGM15180.1 hypothetical protein N867_11095 [Actinotalea fermentans ATCC 43279 = JCM 9966 = DSM 3133]
MADHPHPPASPPALRLRRPGWRDPRLLLGVVLVAASVALGSTLVASAGRTVPVYAAAEALVPGDALAAADLTVRQVRLDAAGATYVRADEPLADDLVATRVVGAGELLPRSAVATQTELGLRPVAIEPDGALPEGLAAGAAVDLWFVPEGDAGVAPSSSVGATRGAPTVEPQLLAAGLTVAEVSEPRGGLAVGSAVTVHVLVPVDELPTVLGALAAEGSVEVVLVPGGGR